MRVQTEYVIALSLLMFLASGCAGGGTVEPSVAQGRRTPATQPVAVGRIDDDTEPEEPESDAVTAVLAPFRGIGSLFTGIGQQVRVLEGDTPSKAAQMTLDTNSADNRRKGVFKLVEYSFANKPPYTTRYEQMARNDPDPTVRAAALRACNWSRDRNATSVFLAMLA